MDETGVQMEHQPTGVVACKGTRAIPGRVSNSRENITIVTCVNAAGETIPHMFIAKGKIYKSLLNFKTADAPPGSLFTYCEQTWINDRLGSEWFVQVFLKHCGKARLILLILDGHKSHESLDILETATNDSIHILCLPPHTTHYLQPLDLTFFGPLTKAYNTVCTEYMAASRQNVVFKASWAGLFRQAWEQAVTPQNIKSGFRACGIMPFNPNAIPEKAFKPSTSWHVPLSPPNVASDEPELPTEIPSAGTSNDADTRSNEFQTVQPSISKHSDCSVEVESVFDIEPVTIDLIPYSYHP